MIDRVGAEVGDLHLAVCRRFTSAVRSADGRWDCPSPCSAWNAGEVVEHVIGFHDVLLLRPLGLKPDRPPDDPRPRWELTNRQVEVALSRQELYERVVTVPGVGNNRPTRLDAVTLMPRLTLDVLVHTWDLARAVGADDALDPAWCAQLLNQLPTDTAALRVSGLFAPPVIVGDQADTQARLLARLGRNPRWRPPGN